MIENKRDERMQNDPKCKIFMDKDFTQANKRQTTTNEILPNSIRARNKDAAMELIKFQDYGFVDKNERAYNNNSTIESN
jgi:hypothetical protein